MTKKTSPAITHFPTHIHPEALKRPPEERKKLIEIKLKEILEILGLDLTDNSLKKTPFRVAKMFVDEIFSGLDPANFPSMTLHEQEVHRDEIIIVKNIHFISFCEHHLVPFIGQAHVAYLPKEKVIGLSKINRIVHYFSKRPQLQERLTAQVADSLALILECDDVAVSMSAKHFCVIARGVEDHECETETHVLRGQFQNVPHRRTEFFSCIHNTLK